MAPLGPVLAAVSAVAGLAGTLMSANAERDAGKSEAMARQMEARALERKAAEDRAAAQREAIRRSKESELANSRAQALAAASGGGATDKTVLDLMAGAAEEGEYQTQAAIYEGESRGRGLESQAEIERFKAQRARKAGNMRANATLLSGASSFAGAASKIKFG